MRPATAGTCEASPAAGSRPSKVGCSSVSGSSTPPCSTRDDVSSSEILCVTSIPGVHTQRFPDHDIAGSKTVAYEVGDKGEKNRLSCPTLSDVLAQSRLILAVRKRSNPVAPPNPMGSPLVVIEKLIEEHQLLNRILRQRKVEVDTQTWNRRYREYTEKIKTGSPLEIAKVLRDLLVLKSDKELSFGERKMLDTARSLLVKELSIAKAHPEEKIMEELKMIFAN